MQNFGRLSLIALDKSGVQCLSSGVGHHISALKTDRCQFSCAGVGMLRMVKTRKFMGSGGYWWLSSGCPVDEVLEDFW